MKNIAIFASGKGSNAQAIIEHFRHNPAIRVALIVTNNPGAGVIKIAHSNKIISAIVTNEALQKEDVLGRIIDAMGIDLIVLAGFLQLVPSFLLKKFDKRIINIHPALLPKHGGKGMYGMKVHEAVLAAGDKETGITIHYVNESYDEGEIILQKSAEVGPADNPDLISKKIHQLEYEWYPRVIEDLLK